MASILSDSIYISKLSRFFVVLIILVLTFSIFVQAAEQPEGLKGVGIKEHPGEQISINTLSFVDEQGKSVLLSNYFKKNRPVLLALVYYKCPNLCNLLLNGLLDSLKKLDWTTGDQFDLVAVSINPQETPKLALDKKENYLKEYQRPNAGQGWHFLTGQEDQIRLLADQVGFQYKYIEAEKQYSHAAALFILTPEGKISRYLYGISFVSKNLRFALMEAANGRIGTVVDRILLFCFHFDPNRNSYTLRMWRIVQIVIVIQVLVLAGLLYTLWKKERPKKQTG